MSFYFNFFDIHMSEEGMICYDYHDFDWVCQTSNACFIAPSYKFWPFNYLFF
jgi:hypothetical protein